MKVRASVRRICEKCKLIRRKGVVRIICADPRHKQRQGHAQDRRRQEGREGIAVVRRVRVVSAGVSEKTRQAFSPTPSELATAPRFLPTLTLATHTTAMAKGKKKKARRNVSRGIAH